VSCCNFLSGSEKADLGRQLTGNLVINLVMYGGKLYFYLSPLESWS